MADEERQSWFRAILPSSLISLTAHVAILIFAGMSLRGCDSGPPVEAGGRDFRTIGLAVIPDASEAVSNQPARDPLDSDIETTSDGDTVAKPVEKIPVPTEKPDVAEMLGHDRAVDARQPTESNQKPLNIVGAGEPIGGLPKIGGLSELIRPKGKSGMGSAGSPTPGPGETSFMNIIGTGRNFVYVIDISSSMGHGGRLALAKSQLIGSLRRLKPVQNFKVLFYNETVDTMTLRRRAGQRIEQDMYPATAVHLQLAKAEIDRRVPSSGTSHFTPIIHALRLEPDVVYFLTDGDKPRLSPSELRKVSDANRSGAQIHVVEFATGPQESRDITWLQLLAQQSGGKYNRVMVD